jgi:methyl-accepting chemotaxis protein
MNFGLLNNTKISVRLGVGFGILLILMVLLSGMKNRVAAVVAVLVPGAVIVWLTGRSITRPLSRLRENVDRIAKGDLTAVAPLERQDEIGGLGRELNNLASFYDKIISSLLTSSNDVMHSVSILKSRTVKTVQGAQKQSAQATLIATSAEEMSQTITDISRNAAAVADSANKAKNTAGEGQQVTSDAVAKVNSVYTSTVELAGRVEQLNKSVGEIGDIVSFITGIADQTNLLALNAAIEAARAGEQGRGFAVVADEVRKLAERTIKATSEISAKIGMVQQESTQTAEVMGATSFEVTSAKEFISKVGDTLLSVTDAVQTVSDQITRIAAAVEQQSAASEDVARNIEQTSHIAHEMETMAGDVTHEVSGLTRIAEDLRNRTAGFTTSVSKTMIFDLAKTDHRIFVDKVGACLNDDTRLDPAELPTHQTCRFGKWYLDEGKRLCGGVASFIAVDEPHAKIHSLAREAVTAHYAGDKARADRLYAEMEKVSVRVEGLLTQMKRECKVDAAVPARTLSTGLQARATVPLSREEKLPEPMPSPRKETAGSTWNDDFSVNVKERGRARNTGRT